MNKFIDIITKHRNLSPITINNYNRGLNNLQKNTGIENHSEFIIKWRDIIKYIMDAPTKQPYKLNILNFYIVALDSYIKEELLEFGAAPGDITGGLAECRKHQFKIKEDLDILKYNETKSEKESTNWVGFEELEKCVKTNFKLVRKIIKSPNKKIIKERFYVKSTNPIGEAKLLVDTWRVMAERSFVDFLYHLRGICTDEV